MITLHASLSFPITCNPFFTSIPLPLHVPILNLFFLSDVNHFFIALGGNSPTNFIDFLTYQNFLLFNVGEAINSN